MVCAPVRRNNPQALARLSTVQRHTCTMISNVDIAYGVSRAKDWVSVNCGTNNISRFKLTWAGRFCGSNFLHRLTSIAALYLWPTLALSTGSLKMRVRLGHQ